jgi:hypothetical protein
MAKESLRAIWKHTHTVARKHLIAQAEVMNATNVLQDAFWGTFSVAMSLERPSGDDEWYAEMKFRNHALAIWHTVQNDAQQRQMAVKALTTVPTKLKLGPARDKLVWAEKKAAKLAEYRNLIAHNPISFKAQINRKKIKWVPRFGGAGLRPASEQKFRLIGGLAFWRSLRNDLLRLNMYVEGINIQIRQLQAASRGAELMSAPKTWPGKPRLRSLPRLLEIEKTLTPAPPKSGQRNRRKPSHA